MVKGPVAQQGKRIASVPEHMASLWSQHRFSIAGIPGFSAGAGVRYVGASWDGTDSLKTPSTTLFDAMLGYAYQTGRSRSTPPTRRRDLLHHLPVTRRLLHRQPSHPDSDGELQL